MARQYLPLGFFVLVSGCASAPPPRHAAPLAEDLDAWVGASERAGARSASLPAARPAEERAAEEPPRAAFTPRRIAAPVEREPRPSARARVDVSFQGADMVNAFQFLADAGRFNLVMADGLGGKVSATLHGVDPYDALVSLAAANGAVVRYDRQIVTVSKR